MPLVCSWGVMASHWHNNPFPKAKRSEGHCKFDMFWQNTHLEKGIHHIHFTPNLAFGTVSKDVINVREGEGIGNSDLVK